MKVCIQLLSDLFSLETVDWKVFKKNETSEKEP